METVDKEVGMRIRKLREERNITREQLADIIGISSKFLYEIETGKKGFSAYYLIPMAKSLSVSSDYLLLGNNDLFCTNYSEDDTTMDFPDLNALISDLSPDQKEYMYDLISTIIKLCK